MEYSAKILDNNTYLREFLDKSATFLVKKNYKDLFPHIKEDSFYDLFYLKEKDVFITISNKPDSNGQELTDEVLDRKYREDYLQVVLPPIDFSGIGGGAGVSYESELSSINLEMILATGRELEKKDEYTFYYLEKFDRFAAVSIIPDPETQIVETTYEHTFQDNSLRKKYNIPFQDERFKDLY